MEKQKEKQKLEKSDYYIKTGRENRKLLNYSLNII